MSHVFKQIERITKVCSIQELRTVAKIINSLESTILKVKADSLQSAKEHLEMKFKNTAHYELICGENPFTEESKMFIFELLYPQKETYLINQGIRLSNDITTLPIRQGDNGKYLILKREENEYVLRLRDEYDPYKYFNLWRTSNNTFAQHIAQSLSSYFQIELKNETIILSPNLFVMGKDIFEQVHSFQIPVAKHKEFPQAVEDLMTQLQQGLLIDENYGYRLHEGYYWIYPQTKIKKTTEETGIFEDLTEETVEDLFGDFCDTI